MSATGIKLIDAYIGPAGVLTGTARVVQEAAGARRPRCGAAGERAPQARDRCDAGSAIERQIAELRASLEVAEEEEAVLLDRGRGRERPARCRTRGHGLGPQERRGMSEDLGDRLEEADDDGHYHLRLYVAGQTPKSLAALANLKRICEEHLAGRYDIEVIDLLKNPQLAAGDQILAIPTLVRRLPEPLKRIIGDLSNTEKVLVGLDIRPKVVMP